MNIRPFNVLLMKKNQQLHAWSAFSRGCLTIDPVMENSWIRRMVRELKQTSPDAKWPYPAKVCFGVIMKFYDWFIILDTSWVGIRSMPDWLPWVTCLQQYKAIGIIDVLCYELSPVPASLCLRVVLCVSNRRKSWRRNSKLNNQVGSKEYTGCCDHRWMCYVVDSA